MSLADRLAELDFKRWYAVWGWNSWDEGEARMRRWYRRNNAKQSHRPKRGRFAGWRGH